jgi:hypothetical protein
MINTLNKILENSKIAYKESVLVDNSVIEEKLLSIISDSKYLIDRLENGEMKTKNTLNGMRTESEEIERVKRRVPQWLNKPNQYNSKILISYMKLSNNNQFPISTSTLEKHCTIDDTHKFTSNYNQMKIISEKNHCKVFSDENGEVKLWEPISDFVISEFIK